MIVSITADGWGLMQFGAESQWSADNTVGRTEILTLYQGNSKQHFWSLRPSDWPSRTEITDSFCCMVFESWPEKSTEGPYLWPKYNCYTFLKLVSFVYSPNSEAAEHAVKYRNKTNELNCFSCKQISVAQECNNLLVRRYNNWLSLVTAKPHNLNWNGEYPHLSISCQLPRCNISWIGSMNIVFNICEYTVTRNNSRCRLCWLKVSLRKGDGRFEDAVFIQKVQCKHRTFQENDSSNRFDEQNSN